MKVDFLIGRLGKGGAERVMTTLSNHFVKMGHQVRIITFDDYPDGYSLHEDIGRIRLMKKRVPNAKLNNAIDLFLFYENKEGRPDIAVSFLTFTNLVSILACKLRRIPIIVSEHNNHTFMLSPKWLVKFTWNYLYQLANYVTVLTDFDVAFYKSKKAQVVVMPNPTSFKTLVSNTHPREKTILAVGSLNRIHHKGFDNLIELMARVLPQHPEWKLKIVGGGKAENLDKLKNLVKEKNLENQIELMGFCDNVIEIMQRASVYILSSRFEGLPMVLLEAMSQGMACISYNCVTGPSNMITHDFNGLLVADQDIEEMENQLVNLMMNEEMRISLGTQAIKSLDQYKIERIYERWETLLMDIDV